MLKNTINNPWIDTHMVSILMPVHNGEKYLAEAIESILNQKYKYFEFIILDDASTDNTPYILSQYEDPRIRIYTNGTNLGVAGTLNRGLKLANGEFIARMDADDISDKNRLSEQVSFLEKNPQIGLCGTWMIAFHENYSHIVKYPTDSSTIFTDLFIYCPIGHPTIMGRKVIFENYSYDENFDKAEDYDLWERISKDYSLANIGIPLYRYRVHPDSVTWQYRSTQTGRSDLVRLRQLQKIGIEPSDYEKFLHISLLCNLRRGFWLYSIDLLKWVRKLINANSRVHKYPDHKFKRILYYYYWGAFRDSIKLLLSPMQKKDSQDIDTTLK